METNTLTWAHTAEVLERYGNEARELYKQNLNANGHPTSESKLLNTAEYKVKMKDHTFIVSMQLQEYWKWVENDTGARHGQKGSTILRDAIRKWIQVKPVLPRPDEHGKLPTLEQLTFLITRKIATEGTKGTHDLKDAVEKLNDEMLESIDKAITEDIGAAVDIIIASYISK